MADQEADKARFTVLYESCYYRVLAYALRRVSAEEARDVAAEVFLVAWRRLDDVPAAHGLPWLLAVAHKTLSQQRRAAGRRTALQDEIARTQVRSAVEADELEAAVVERLSVLNALAHLSEADREALMLTTWDGLSTREAGIATGRSAAAFAVQLHRARRRFASALTAADTNPKTARSADDTPDAAKRRTEGSRSDAHQERCAEAS